MKTACVVCGNQFEQNGRRGRPRKTCGANCASVRVTSHYRREHAAAKVGEPSYGGMSVDNVGAALGVSGQTVCNIEERALRKLRLNSLLLELWSDR